MNQTGERRTVVVTGGSRGIGRAICFRLAADGYAVAVNYTAGADAAEAVAAGIRENGGRAVAIRADIADPAAIATLFATAEAELGPLHGLVANAGILGAKHRVDEQSFDDLQRLFAVNVLGLILCAREAVRRLSTRHGGPGGAIVNVSSVAARLGGLSGLIPYAATKGAVDSFTRGLSNEVAGEGIRVNAVAPGITETDMTSDGIVELARTGTPMGRAGRPEEIAEAVAWLISPAASYVSGTVLTASGGR